MAALETLQMHIFAWTARPMHGVTGHIARIADQVLNATIFSQALKHLVGVLLRGEIRLHQS